MPDDFTEKAIQKYLADVSRRPTVIEYGRTKKLKKADYKAIEFDVYENNKIDAGWMLNRKIANLQNCLDVALATGDREWFDKLQKRYQALLKRADKENNPI